MAISLFKKGNKKYTITGIIIIVVLLGIIVHVRGSQSSIILSAVVSQGKVVEIVSVTGQVVPVGKADLAFEKGGVISTINVKVGNSVKKGDVLATLDSASDKASLASAQAKLNDMTRSLRPEELAVDQAKVTAAKIVLQNALQDGVNASNQAYVSAQSAVTNYADLLFTNPQSANPVILIQAQSQLAQITIDQERLSVSSELTQWKADNNTYASAGSSSQSNISAILAKSAGHIAVIKSFISDLSTTVNTMNPGNNGISQNLINSYVATVNSAMTNINQSGTTITAAQTELSNASSSLDSAQSQFTLNNAGSSADAIAAQSAQVALYQAQLNEDRLISPIDGIVSKADPNVGEFVNAGGTGFGVINNTVYKIEAYVPEADIAKVAIGNTASVTLDAYGSDVIFPAHVTDVDPAETILQGVPTYKVTLYFDTNDTRIRSGMTANTDILTHEVDNVLEIPYRAVTDIGGVKSVHVVSDSGISFATTTITVGLRGSDGTIQVLSGLTAGQKVSIDPKK